MIVQEINETNFRQRSVLQDKLEEKFKQWDRLGKANISKKELKEKMSDLWKDPTIWAYATLRDKQNKPLKCWYYQDMILNEVNRFVDIVAANQIGKTWAVCIKAIHHALFVNNASVMIISAKEKNAINVLDEIKWMLKRARISYNEVMDEVDNRTEIHLKSPDGIGTSVIRVFPPTTKILGFPATLVIMDETGFWENTDEMDPVKLYQQVIEPRTNTTKNWDHDFLTMGQIISISNPNGMQGLAWNLHNDKRYRHYVYNWLACPGNSLEEYNFHKNDRQNFPPHIFASVYAAQFVSAAGGFITQEQIERFSQYNIPLAIPPGSLLFLGADLAGEGPQSRSRDFNVMYGVIQTKNEDFPMHPRVRVVYMKEWPAGTKKTVIYHEINRLKNLPGVTLAKFAYDKMGVADSVKNDLMGRGILMEHQIEALTYSLQNKSDIYLNIQALFAQDMLEGTHIPKLREQILGLVVEDMRNSVHIKVHHKTEGIKDDHPDALANACYAAKLLNNVPVTMEFIPHEAKKPIDLMKKRPKNASLVVCSVCNEEYTWSTEKKATCDDCKAKSELKTSREAYLRA